MHQHYDPKSDTNTQRDAMSQQERQTKSTRKVSSTCITKIGGLYVKSPRLNGQKHVLIGHSLYAPPHHQIGNCLHRTPKVLQSDIGHQSFIEENEKQQQEPSYLSSRTFHYELEDKFP